MRGRTFFRQLVTSYMGAALVGLLLLGIALDTLLEDQAFDALERSLVAQAATVSAALDTVDEESLQERVEELGRASATRVTVIDADGEVLADSTQNPTSMDDHSSRPEVKDSLAGKVGSAQRTSSTTGRPYLYVSLPLRGDRVYRAALPLDVVHDQRRRARVTVALASALVAVVLTLLSIFNSKRIAGPLERMAREVGSLQRGEQSEVSIKDPPELAFLGRAINQLSTELASRIEDLAGERELRDEILSAMSIGLVLTSGDRVIFANTAAETMLGVGRMADLQKHVASEQGAWEFTGSGGARRDLRATSISLKDSRILTLIEDITESKRLDEIRRNFISNASHELKTPVAALLASSETVVNALADGEIEAASRFAGRLTSEAQRISRLVEDLLDLAKLEAPLALNAQVDLAQVILSEAASYSAAAERKGLKLHVDIRDGAIVVGDPEALALLVRNLLENAIRYTHEGEVSVGLSVSDSHSVIEVRDTGIGIPGSDRVRIFERFYRVDRARSRETGGTGLGLSIVKNVAERHGGSVDVESEIGRGSRFLVTLPLS